MSTPTDQVQAILDAYDQQEGDYVDDNGVVINNIILCADCDNDITVLTPNNSEDDPIVIINPPVYIPDNTGDVVLGDVTYRYDPLGAVATVIKQYGGA